MNSEKSKIRIVLVLWFLVMLPVGASSNFELGQSVSSFYDSRSVFSNPAALGYQTELNGAAFSTAHLFGLQKSLAGEWESSVSYGYLGAGWERLESSLGGSHRFSLGLGFPFGNILYLGGRYRFTQSDIGVLNNINYFDLGFQVRPHATLSTGVLVEGLNRPTVAGLEQPLNYTWGTTIRPADKLDLQFDMSTPSNHFLSDVTYQAGVGITPVRGFRVYAAYHSELKFLAGLSLDFGHVAVIARGQTGNGSSRVYSGFQYSTDAHPSSFEPKTLKITLDHNLSEVPVRGGWLTAERPSLMNVLELLEKARHQKNVRKIKIRLADFPMGYASAQEIYEALWRLREAGKTIDIYLSNAGLREYLIASAADKIYMEPSAELKLAGLSVGRYFIKGTLEKIGVEGQFLARGEYKSAPEMFTRNESSPISRDQTLTDLKTAENEIRRLISKGRTISDADWKELQKTALLSSDEAKEFGLVDDISHFEETANNFDDSPGTDNLRHTSDALALPDRVAVIIAQGDILQRKMKLLSFAGQDQLTPDSMEKKFRAAVADPRVKAIVLRISSPGGEVVASDQIASVVEAANRKKPVVVSMGDVAASGGYFIAAPARTILASPLTLTGSIGVFLGKFNLGQLYKKIGLQKEILSYAPFPGLLSEDRSWTPEERTILLKRLNQFYESFVDYVGHYRHLSKNEAESAAKGRVWLGIDAKQKKLTDVSGGLSDAIRLAAQYAGLADQHYETVAILPSRGIIDLIGDPEELPGVQRDAPRFLRQGLFQEVRWAESLAQSPFLLISPVERLD